jgi:RNA polymerase sigma factor (sigma-70 family)
MDELKWLAERFEEQRPRLRAVAYRMLGSLSEAEDAVQEAWLRLSGTTYDELDDLGAWLTTVVARISLNMLRSRKTRNEAHLPDPIVDRADGTTPEHGALLANTVGLALLVVLESLAPAERVAFVLHDIFGMPFEEIAPIVERTPDAARQLASRARRRVQARKATADADAGMVELRGADRVARGAQTFSRKGVFRRPALINGAPGLVAMLEGKLLAVMAFTVRNGKITEIDLLRDPARLRQLDLTALDD